MTIADAQYVSFTSYRRNGDAVPTAVWIAPMSGGRAGFTTAADSGKVKRLRNNPAVTLRKCDARGRVPDGAEEVTATAEVVIGGTGFEEVRTAMKGKYGLRFAAVHLGGKFKKLIGRGEAANCGIVIAFT